MGGRSPLRPARIAPRLRLHWEFTVSDSVSTSPVNGSGPGSASVSGGAVSGTGGSRVKRGMAEMLKGGVIMDVVTPEQARIAEDAGAVAVMALERVPADIRANGGVARM